MFSLNDRTVSFTYAASLGLWTIGFALIVIEIFANVGIGQLGLFMAGAGGVMTIRAYLCRLDQRERNAFELGRDSAGVRSVH